MYHGRSSMVTCAPELPLLAAVSRPLLGLSALLQLAFCAGSIAMSRRLRMSQGSPSTSVAKSGPAGRIALAAGEVIVGPLWAVTGRDPCIHRPVQIAVAAAARAHAVDFNFM